MSIAGDRMRGLLESPMYPAVLFVDDPLSRLHTLTTVEFEASRKFKKRLDLLCLVTHNQLSIGADIVYASVSTARLTYEGATVTYRAEAAQSVGLCSSGIQTRRCRVGAPSALALVLSDESSLV